MITQQLYLTAVLVRPGWSVRIKMKIKIQEDDVMWFEGSGANARDGMSELSSQKEGCQTVHFGGLLRLHLLDLGL